MDDIMNLITFSQPDDDSEKENRLPEKIIHIESQEIGHTEVQESSHTKAQEISHTEVQESSHTEAQEISDIQAQEMIYKETDVSELIGLQFDKDDDAFDAYRRYAYVKCFGVRRDGFKYNVKNEPTRRLYCCSKAGTKTDKGVIGKKYAKLDRRTDCKAHISFKIIDSKFLCVEHRMVHNHTFCHPSEVHNLRCHREVSNDEVKFLVHLRNSGIRLADAMRFLSKEAGGSPAIGFSYRDALAAVNKLIEKKFDVTDCNTFVNILKERASNEVDFYYDFELDEDNSLVSVFFRDKKMREDYEAFPEVLGNDGTYCSNRHDLICAPFVGINHHTKICLFGIGFILNESIESFTWLYKTFLKSMGGIQPKTVMTDQCAAMASAIKSCFPSSKHRLCIWHLFKNSTAYLGGLKEKSGLHMMFSRIMKKCHTEAELLYWWNRMESEFVESRDNAWLMKLFEIREKWCCAYGKDYFSAGVLSSQRSESANHSICRMLNKTTKLCVFYDVFGGVISDWRSNVRKDNTQCWDGLPEVVIPCSLLENASKVYTISAYKRLEKEFIKSMSYTHKFDSSLDETYSYLVGTSRSEEFDHYVTFDTKSHYAGCTCKRFEENGLLCHHILRIYNCNSVEKIPDVYILKRWTKFAKPKDDVSECIRGKVAGPVWRLDMHRKFHKLIVSSMDNDQGRQIMNDCFENAKCQLENMLGTIAFSDAEGDGNETDVIQYPKKRNTKGERFKRKRSVIDIAASRKKSTIKAAETRARKRQQMDESLSKQVVDSSISIPRGNVSKSNRRPRHMGLKEIIMTDL